MDNNHADAHTVLEDNVAAGFINSTTAQDLYELYLEEVEEHSIEYALYSLRECMKQIQSEYKEQTMEV